MVSLDWPPGRENQCLGHEAPISRMFYIPGLYNDASWLLFFFFFNILGHQTITFYISLNGKVPLLSYNQIWKFVKSKCFMLRKQKKTKGLWVDSSTVTIWFYNSRLANVLKYFLCKSFTFLLHFQLKSLN